MSIKAVVTELKVQQILVEQMRVGTNLDISHCERSIEELDTIRDNIHDKIKPQLKPDVVPLEGKVTRDMVWKPREFQMYKGDYQFVKKKFLKNGDLVNSITLYCEKTGMNSDDISGPFSRVAFEELELSKRAKLAKQLQNLGWVPSEFTDKGAPKLTVDGEPCPNLEMIDGDVGKDLTRWFKASHRKSQIQGWLDRARPDGRIEAGINACSTNTGRSRHFGVANIPKAIDAVFFGKEMRAAFCATEGYELCGWDSSGLEARVAGHYTYLVDNGEFANEILEGDIHQKNADHFGIGRSQAKQVYYGLT